MMRHSIVRLKTIHFLSFYRVSMLRLKNNNLVKIIAKQFAKTLIKNDFKR